MYTKIIIRIEEKLPATATSTAKLKIRLPNIIAGFFLTCKSFSTRKGNITPPVAMIEERYPRFSTGNQRFSK
jgi:hypothetical protein